MQQIIFKKSFHEYTTELKKGLNNLKKQNLYIRTFGCQMNVYDSEKIVDILRADYHGCLDVVFTPEDADLIIFNTCSIREKAQEKVFSDLGRVRNLKKKKPDLIIAVGGCVASQEGDSILKRAPYVDIIFGPQTLHRLPQLIKKSKVERFSQVDISFPEIEKFDFMPPAKIAGVNASISIMEGCSKYCSFCVVPYTRGPEFSRPFKDILMEIADLSEQGVREITLLGQNVNAYSSFINDEPADFSMLLEYIHEIPGIERIRYTTSHPKDMTQSVADAYIKLPKLASFIHLPVQSGSDRILAAMKRGYNVAEFKSVIRNLRNARSNLSFSSDFIIGFPGETEEDFQDTLKLVKDIGFDNSFSFIYSPRPGTPAENIVDHTPRHVKLRRLNVLQELIKKQANDITKSMIGTKQLLLVEKKISNHASRFIGRTENNRIVEFESTSTDNLIGQVVNVIILGKKNMLQGSVVSSDLE